MLLKQSVIHHELEVILPNTPMLMEPKMSCHGASSATLCELCPIHAVHKRNADCLTWDRSANRARTQGAATLATARTQ
eukprot:3753772-Amphidinium_carterae.1